jgi:pimeloyl-ACP methyl ester carboxylesterase
MVVQVRRVFSPLMDGALSGLSPRRRALLLGVALLVLALVAAVAVTVLVRHVGRRGVPAADRPGPVLLVPGYGGNVGSLDPLAARLRATGREVTEVPLPGDGTGDLAQQAATLDGYVTSALKSPAGSSAGSVDVVGYSAGGVVARLWVQRYDGAHKARRVVTLGSPHHGTSLAAAGTVLAPGACPTACQQLAPGSSLLAGLRTPVPAPPAWLAVWTDDDETVTPPDSGRVEGATNLELQSVCPGLTVSHGQLPSNAFVQAAVLDALGPAPIHLPTAADCG